MQYGAWLRTEPVKQELVHAHVLRNALQHLVLKISVFCLAKVECTKSQEEGAVLVSQGAFCLLLVPKGPFQG